MVTRRRSQRTAAAGGGGNISGCTAEPVAATVTGSARSKELRRQSFDAELSNTGAERIPGNPRIAAVWVMFPPGLVEHRL